MSFSGEMKEEIARLIPEKEEEVRAELMAIIRFCGRILRQRAWQFSWKQRMSCWQRRMSN